MLTKTEYRTGDRVRVVDFPSGGEKWIGKTGWIKAIDRSSRITELQLEMDDKEGQLWVSERWVELLEDELEAKEETGLTFWEGDRVRGEHIGNGSTVEGIVKSVGKKYLKLTSGEAIHKATAEMLERGAEAWDADEPTSEPEPKPERKLQIGDRVTHQTIPGIGEIKKILRRGRVSVYFEGDGITSALPSETLTLCDEDNRSQGSGEAFTGEFGRSYEAEANAAIADSTPLTEAITAEIIPSDPSDRLTQLEGEILAGMKLMEEGKTKVWQAVAAIRAENLWEINGHRSFREYVQVRFGWKESYAHEIASAGETAAQLLSSGIPEDSLPDAAAAYRPLKNLAPEQQIEAIQKAVEVSNGKPTAKVVKAAVAEIQGKSKANALEPLPPICAPSITPAEFNAEMEARDVFNTGCHTCEHRRMAGSGDRYWCAEGKFDDTLLLRDNWAVMEGCDLLTPWVAEPQPAYEVPKGVCRLKLLPDGGCEIFDLVLSEQQTLKIAVLSRKLDGSRLTAIKYLIDQLPDVEL